MAQPCLRNIRLEDQTSVATPAQLCSNPTALGMLYVQLSGVHDGSEPDAPWAAHGHGDFTISTTAIEAIVSTVASLPTIPVNVP